MEKLEIIVKKESLTRDDIVYLLSLKNKEKTRLFEKSAAIKEQHVGNKVYFRGLIEFSNVCLKNCLYCGIRHDNNQVHRYNLTDDEIIDAARFAAENNYGSLVLQSGEIQHVSFTRRIEQLLIAIHQATGGKLRVTLSCGEQSSDTYKVWHDSGAHRYLLRIESSNPELYKKLHPKDENHSFQRRLDSLFNLQQTGYQVGTGVMIGLPFQTLDDLAGDLLFMQQFSIDMVGMGPYLEHEETPLYEFREMLLPGKKGFSLH